MYKPSLFKYATNNAVFFIMVWLFKVGEFIVGECEAAKFKHILDNYNL
jgi:hypothetical protein